MTFRIKLGDYSKMSRYRGLQREDFWTREQVEEEIGRRVFLFGDNTYDRIVSHNVPSSTQAVIRGLKNAIGIDTKKNRYCSQASYFSDTDFKEFKMQVDDAIMKAKQATVPVVVSTQGIGTGKARLEEKAPDCFKYLQAQLKALDTYLIWQFDEAAKAVESGSGSEDVNAAGSDQDQDFCDCICHSQRNCDACDHFHASQDRKRRKVL